MSLQLEAFLGRWRAFLQPRHALLFSQLNGAPLTVQGVYKVFQTSAFRISGKKTNPHLVRDMVVTHLRCPWLAPSLRLYKQRSLCPGLRQLCCVPFTQEVCCGSSLKASTGPPLT